MPRSAHDDAMDLAACWRQKAMDLDPAFKIPATIDYMANAAWEPVNFNTILGNLSRDLSAQSWLVEDAGYGWVLERDAYIFPNEALNQGRVLNTLAALAELAPTSQWQVNAANMAARQTLRWRLADSGPVMTTSQKWRFLVIPFGWDNLTILILYAMQAHMVATGTDISLFQRQDRFDEWHRPAKGLFLAAMNVPGGSNALIDSYIIAAMQKAHSWFDDAIFSQQQFNDPTGRTLWSLISDYVIGHEIAHAVLHGDQRGKARNLKVEIEADRAALFALWKWRRPRDLTSLSSEHGQGLWDYLSALLGLFVLSTAGALQQGFFGKLDIRVNQRVEETSLRSKALRQLILDNPSITGLTTSEFKIADALLEAFQRFLYDLCDLQSRVPPDADVALQGAARAAIAHVEAATFNHFINGS